MASEVSDTTVFTLFSELPPEVRCQIWHTSLPEPRIVPILYDEATTSYTARIRPPANLQVNRESRHEALKVYHELRLGISTNTGCYIDPLRDTVYLKTNLNRASNRIDELTPIEPWQRGRLITTSRSPAETTPASTQSTQSDQVPTPDPSYIEPTDFQSGMLRSRRHSKIILDDLIHSPDAETIFKCLYINHTTWELIRRYHRHRRHKIPIQLSELCLVYESGSAPLKSNFEMHYIGPPAFPDPMPPPIPDANREAHKYVYSLRASNSFVNHRDRKHGRPVALQYSISAKSLDKGDSSSAIDVASAMLPDIDLSASWHGST